MSDNVKATPGTPFPPNPVDDGSDIVEKIKQLCCLIQSCGNMIPYNFDGCLTLEQKFQVLMKAVQDNMLNQTELLDTWKEVYTWINNYFKNLDVQQEINNKLDEIIASGEFEGILNEYFGDLTSKVNEINSKVDAINGDITSINTILSKLQPDSIKTVGTGCDFTSIADAVTYFKQKYNLQTFGDIKCAILISPGTYPMAIDDTTLGQIAFIGIGKPILTSNSSYPIGNINCYGDIYMNNLIFKCTAEDSYCYHFEGGGYARNNPSTLGAYIENCEFISDYIAVGIGSLNSGLNLTFKNCVFRGKASLYDVYIHNSTHENSYNNLITFINCVTANSQVVRIEDAARVNTNRSSRLDVIFRGNFFRYMSFYGGNQGDWANQTVGAIPINHDNIILNAGSCNNEGLGFNSDTRRKTIEGYYPKLNKLNWGAYNYTLFCDRANEYDWTLFQAITGGGSDVKNNCTVTVPGGNSIVVIADSSSEDVDSYTNVTIIGIPKVK